MSNLMIIYDVLFILSVRFCTQAVRNRTKKEQQN
jgi:hypothetical protein